ncbi:MAG: hypothetical protein RL141_922 [Candidatus Parcubacteria bacterium]|jgi:RimJ/RimL family protein N-acetyltransferase
MISPRSLGIHVRRATIKDGNFLYRLRNDREVRQQFLNGDAVAYADHIRWLTATIASPRRVLLVGSDAAGRVFGQLRFDRVNPRWIDVSISIARSHRGRGFAVPFLQKGIAALAKQPIPSPKPFLRAQIKRTNPASIHTFERAGFMRYAGTAMYIFLRRTIKIS